MGGVILLLCLGAAHDGGAQVNGVALHELHTVW